MDVLHPTGTIDSAGKLALNIHANTHLSPGIVEVCIVIGQTQKIPSDAVSIEKKYHNMKDYLLSGPSWEGIDIERDMSISRPIEL